MGSSMVAWRCVSLNLTNISENIRRRLLKDCRQDDMTGMHRSVNVIVKIWGPTRNGKEKEIHLQINPSPCRG